MQAPGAVTAQTQPRQASTQQKLPTGRPTQQASATRPMRPAQRPVTEVQNDIVADGSRSKKSGSWKVILQFVIGLLVIAGVATAIVLLYTKYYAQ